MTYREKREKIAREKLRKNNIRLDVTTLTDEELDIVCGRNGRTLTDKVFCGALLALVALAIVNLCICL